MISGEKKIFSVAFLLAFLFIAGVINYFHTDGIWGMDPCCPACAFQSSTIATAQVVVVDVPQLVAMGFCQIETYRDRESQPLPAEPARAPPIR